MLLGYESAVLKATYLALRSGAHPLEERAQRHPGPLADIVPALDADMPDDHLAFGKVGDLLPGPGALVVDEAGELQPPRVPIDRLDILDLVIGVEAGRLQHHRARVFGRQFVGIEQSLLDAVVEGGHGAQRLADGGRVADVAAGQHGQRAERQAAAQETATLHRADLPPVIVEDARIRRLERAEERLHQADPSLAAAPDAALRSTSPRACSAPAERARRGR